MVSLTNNDYVHNLWKKIVSELYSKPAEIQTIRLNNSKGVWFLASSRYGIIEINKSQVNKSSSKLKNTRKINKKEFIELYPYYKPWKEGCSRKSMQGLSLNTSYILALISHFEKDNQ